MLRRTAVRQATKWGWDSGSRTHQSMYPGHYDKKAPSLRHGQYTTTAIGFVGVLCVLLATRKVVDSPHGALVKDGGAWEAQAEARAARQLAREGDAAMKLGRLKNWQDESGNQ